MVHPGSRVQKISTIIIINVINVSLSSILSSSSPLIELSTSSLIIWLPHPFQLFQTHHFLYISSRHC